MPCRALTLAPILLGGIVAAANAQEVSASWWPETPSQGSFTYVTVGIAGQEPTVVRGALDRAPLHFERRDDRFVALAAVRIDATDSVRLALWIEFGDDLVETTSRWLPVTRTAFAIERLTVAPEFSERPDSALAARIEREVAQALAVSRRAHETPRLWREAFNAPRVSRVTSPYGKGRIFNGELRSRHMGTDFDGNSGDPVLVANRGVVELIGDFYYAGSVIYVNHGAGVVTAYMHLSESLVSVGDTVTRGQLIGRVGQSGRVTGPHLHWTAKYGTASMNALSLLGLPALEAVAQPGSP
ncbi:MAG TPA: M23 family metallopeptidase [Gemmatimonadales bacterium]